MAKRRESTTTPYRFDPVRRCDGSYPVSHHIMRQFPKNTYVDRPALFRDYYDIPEDVVDVFEYEKTMVIKPRAKEYDIMPWMDYPKIANNVITVKLHSGESMSIHEPRIVLKYPNTRRKADFVAAITSIDNGAILFFKNGKLVVTGLTTPECALYALHLYRLALGNVSHPVFVKPSTTMINDKNNQQKQQQHRVRKLDHPPDRLALTYLKFLLELSDFCIQNVVCSGPITSEGEIVDLVALSKAYEDSKYRPDVFPALKFEFPPGHERIPGGGTAHLFEVRAVCMGLESVKSANECYWEVLKIVKPFIIKPSMEYKDSKYVDRFNRMMWRRNNEKASSYTLKRNNGDDDDDDDDIEEEKEEEEDNDDVIEKKRQQLRQRRREEAMKMMTLSSTKKKNTNNNNNNVGNDASRASSASSMEDFDFIDSVIDGIHMNDNDDDYNSMSSSSYHTDNDSEYDDNDEAYYKRLLQDANGLLQS